MAVVAHDQDSREEPASPASAPSSSRPGGYPAIFHDFAIRSTSLVLDAVREVETVPTSELANQAMHTLGFALKIDEAWLLASEMLLLLSPKLERAGYRDEWSPFMELGIQRGQEMGDKEAVARLSCQLGILRQQHGNYADATRDLELSANYFRKIGDNNGLGKVLNRLANIAALQLQLDNALQLAETALSLLDEDNPERAYSLHVLGDIARRRMNMDQAVAFKRQSLAIWRETGNRYRIASGLSNLGRVLREAGESAEAISCFEQAIELFDQENDPVYKANATLNLGNIFLADDPERALALYLEAEKGYLLTGDNLRLAIVNNNKGMALRSLNRLEESERAHLISIERRRRVGNPFHVANTMDGLGLVYLAQERYAEAIAVFQEALATLEEAEDNRLCDFLRTELIQHLQGAMQKREEMG